MPSHLEEFMKKLKEKDDDTIFSTPPEENIQVIPPVKSSQSIQVEEPKEEPKEPLKVIPPEREKPKFNFKINNKPKSDNNLSEQNNQETQPVIISKPPKVEKPPENFRETQEHKYVQKQPEVRQQENKPPIKSQDEIEREKAEMLFIQSGTSQFMKVKWFEQFDKAKKSVKSNYVVDKMKRGKFMLNNDGQLLFLPEHETYGKSSDDLLTEHWL